MAGSRSKAADEGYSARRRQNTAANWSSGVGQQGRFQKRGAGLRSPSAAASRQTSPAPLVAAARGAPATRTCGGKQAAGWDEARLRARSPCAGSTRSPALLRRCLVLLPRAPPCCHCRRVWQGTQQLVHRAPAHSTQAAKACRPALPSAPNLVGAAPERCTGALPLHARPAPPRPALAAALTPTHRSLTASAGPGSGWTASRSARRPPPGSPSSGRHPAPPRRNCGAGGGGGGTGVAEPERGEMVGCSPAGLPWLEGRGSLRPSQLSQPTGKQG